MEIQSFIKKSNMKNLISLKSTFKIFFLLILLLIVLEILSKIIVYIGYGYLKKPNDIIRNDNLNSYVQLLEEQSKCNYFSSLFPHPYLGWVHWNNPKCSDKIDFNSDGFPGPEFPIKKYEKFFDILITGGSVSAQFGPGKNCKNKENPFCRNFLEETLKEYVSSDKKKIRVYNAGAGAYKHPHQSIIATLFGKSFDLIVSIEGFNEHYMLYEDSQKKFSFPASNFNISTNGFYINNGFNKLTLKLILSYKNLANKFAVIDNSHFHSLSYRILKIIAEKTILTANDKRQNFSNLWEYDKSQLNAIDIEKFKYENLVSLWKNFIASSNSNGAKGIIILHPVPQLFKTLSEVEKNITNHKNYKEIFLKMADEAEKLRLNENLMVYDFLDIFDQYDETIYTDHSHMNAKGNEIMATNLRDILISKKMIIKKID